MMESIGNVASSKNMDKNDKKELMKRLISVSSESSLLFDAGDPAGHEVTLDENRHIKVPNTESEQSLFSERVAEATETLQSPVGA